ncbi:MAG: type II secretion system protein [Phycisphaerae bacterium]|nr:type II secretion system protein [Phycisphaerae bacterium]
MKQKAFTLIELLVVISIITLLVSIIMPSVGKARLYAKQVVCSTNVTALCKGLSMYETANPGWLPLAVYEQINPDDVLVVEVMKPYIETPETWRCPGDDMGLFEAPNRQSSYDYLGVLLIVAAQDESDLTTARERLMEYSREIPLIVDAEAFHPSSGRLETRNYGFLDGHIEFTDEFHPLYEQFRQEAEAAGLDDGDNEETGS